MELAFNPKLKFKKKEVEKMEAEKYILEIQNKKRNEIIGEKIMESIKNVLLWTLENKEQLGINSTSQAIDAIGKALNYIAKINDKIDESEKQQIGKIMDKFNEELFDLLVWALFNMNKLWIDDYTTIPEKIVEALDYTINSINKEIK
jgi:hypothetical protein